MKKIFIGCPITKYIDNNTFTDEIFRCFMKEMYDLCTHYADEVFLALKREQYGKNLMTDTCTELDYNEMKTADIIVAIPEDSKGTAVELGWASAMKKKIVLILNKGKRYTPLISGLEDITDTLIIWYDKSLNDQVLHNVSLALDTLSEGL
ncbi:nucleoside 2-deoxyribosyltransferase [Clostridium sp. TF11-13AC]|uniref:nucleoside 2-deoxyribosyltransferase n=1 Tax=Clostridium sp. TF11-13AC TaxID=2293053 RepID=UPI000E4DCBD7|nr:nucleoside 2-deoxyribosyltransferase [Clostridium sp. TF11-13AC]RHU42080.1 hypothetical protein DXD12_13650 [Clostridium sp. TF11-13AC]